MSTLQLNNATVVVEPTKVEIKFSDAEDARLFGTVKQTIVNSYLSGLVNNALGRYPVRKHGRYYLNASLKEVKATPFQASFGYMIGTELEDLTQRETVHRVKEIIPTEWYRLGWDGIAFTTQDVTFVPHTEGEYSGSGGPKHNRNSLAMINGFIRLANNEANKVNVALGFTEAKNDAYIVKVVETLNLLAVGDLEAAKARYNLAAETAQVKGVVSRVRAGGKVEIPEDATVTIIVGKEEKVVDFLSLLEDPDREFSVIVGKTNPHALPYVGYSKDEKALAEMYKVMAANGSRILQDITDL